MKIGDETIAFVDAVRPLPSLAFAVTVHDAGARGAVNNPTDVIVPQDAVYVAPTFVVNCCVTPSITVGLTGLIANVEEFEAVITSYPYTVYFGEVVAIPSIVQLAPTVPLAV
jgi:hypothetical protein